MYKIREFRLEKLNRTRFESSRFNKAILVTGATENHGFHLPMGMDTYAAYAIAERTAAQVEGTLLLPPIHFGVSDGLMPYPFNITMRPETLAKVIFDALESCIVQGIDRLLIVNGHGGNNSAIDVALARLRREHPRAKVAVSYAWWISGPRLCPPGTFGRENGLGHAGEAETAAGLAIVPELVDMDAAQGEWPARPAEVSARTTIPEISKTGATGDPTGATREQGEKMIEAFSCYLARFLKEMDRTDWRFAREDWDF